MEERERLSLQSRQLAQSIDLVREDAEAAITKSAELVRAEARAAREARRGHSHLEASHQYDGSS